MVSNDPDFEVKAVRDRAVSEPPAHAAVFCVDEKTAIQVLDRKDRMLQLSPVASRVTASGIRSLNKMTFAVVARI